MFAAGHPFVWSAPPRWGVRRLDPALMGWCLLFVRFNILSPFTSNRLPFHTSAHQHPK
jgi:hypothetical protein